MSESDSGDNNSLAFTDDSIALDANKISGATFSQADKTVTVSTNQDGTITIQVTGGDDITDTSSDSNASIIMSKDSMVLAVGEKMSITLGSDGIVLKNGDDMNITLGSSDLSLQNSSSSKFTLTTSDATIDSGATVKVSSGSVDIS